MKLARPADPTKRSLRRQRLTKQSERSSSLGIPHSSLTARGSREFRTECRKRSFGHKLGPTKQVARLPIRCGRLPVETRDSLQRIDGNAMKVLRRHGRYPPAMGHALTIDLSTPT